MSHLLEGLFTPFGGPSRDHVQLREYVRIAAKVLGRDVLKRPPLILPPRHEGRGVSEKFGMKTAAGRQRRTEYAKQIVVGVAERFGFALPKVALKFSELEGHAGHVQLRSGVWYIDAAEAYRWDDMGLTAIMAHEFAHIVLGSKAIRLEPTQRNEELTDTVAALVGYGRILYAVAERTEEQYRVTHTRRITRTMGYLKRPALSSLMATQRRLRSGQPKRRLSPIFRDLAECISCLACGVAIRLPETRGRIVITCRVCGLRQDVVLRTWNDGAAAMGRGRLGMKAAIAIDKFNGFEPPYSEHQRARS